MRKGSLFKAAGILCLAAAMALSGYNLWDDQRASQEASHAVEQMVKAEIISVREEPGSDFVFQPEVTDLSPQPSATVEPAIYELNPEMEMPVKNVSEWEYIGVLEFPWRNVTLPIISEWSYPALKAAPCRYSGSAYTGDLIISGHNYRAHFACLKRLTIGEPVRFTDMDGNVFEYTVVGQEVLYPSDVAGMKDGEWDLTLFTCTVGGEHRVAVRCALKGHM